MAKLKSTARQCVVCGGPVQDRNTLGICHRTAECERRRSELNRRAKGMKRRGTGKGGCRAGTCPEPHYGEGWCNIHWNRVRKTGEPGPAERLRTRYTVKAGDVLGCWTALEAYNQDVIHCRCTCGRERLMRLPYLLAHVDDPCICDARKGRPPGRDVVFNGQVRGSYLPAGAVFGRLTLLEDASHSASRVKCRCECGGDASPMAANIKQGKIKSCGCLAQETRTKHGLCKHPLYGIWRGMLGRCANPNFREYPDYGGRGIRVCERWMGLPDGLLNFAADIGPRPSPQHTVDRTNVHGNYEPANVKWRTWSEQNGNRRKVGDLTRERDELLAQVEELTAALAAAQVPGQRVPVEAQGALFD
jgi:hypothetical protein